MASKKSQSFVDVAEMLKREFPGLANPDLHYLDSAATAQMPEAVLQALRNFEIEARANVHEEGLFSRARFATNAYDQARSSVAHFINSSCDREIIFTSGATSSINLLAHSFGSSLSKGDEILLSVLEHHSNLLPWQALARQRGILLRFLPVTCEGRLDLASFRSLLTEKCRLVSITHCSNVTGAITDVAFAVSAARTVGAKVFLDGAQAVAHGPIDVQELGIDFYAFSGHKAYGPTGIGVLWGRAELLDSLPPFMTGGQMADRVTLTSGSYRSPPRRFEAGTPPISAAIGLGAAVEWMRALNWEAVQANETRLTRELLDGLAEIRRVHVHGPCETTARRGVVSFSIENVPFERVCRHLDARGVAVRGGLHCAQPLFDALGLNGAARASLALYNTAADVEALLEGVREIANSR